MFTHDVHKKQKKWHDGTLRFHTFNKRVMVYDDSKNFVGDLHYRLNEEFGEGQELRLERPVLVQVEEQLGQTKTDLTPLLGRQRQDGNAQANSFTQPTRATLPRINASNPQIKPKSIKELLGASQGRLGRSRILSQSPYEQRQIQSEAQSNESPAKRRKVGNGKENELASVQRSAEPILPEQDPKQITSKQRRTEQRTAEEVVELSSDEGHINPSRKVSECDAHATNQPKTAAVVVKSRFVSADKDVPQSRQGPAAPSSKSKKSTPAGGKTSDQRDRARQKKVSRTKVCELNQHAKNAPPPQATGVSNTSAASYISPSTGPRSSLKFATSKARPKLMYKALLPDTGPDQISNRSDGSVLSAENPTTHNARQKRQPRTSAIDMDNFFAASQIADASTDGVPSSSQLPKEDASIDGDMVSNMSPVQPYSQSSRGNRLAEEVSDGVNVETVADSPLFMPRSTSQILSPLGTQDFRTNDLDLPLLSQTSPEDDPREQEVYAVGVGDNVQHLESVETDGALMTAFESDHGPNDYSKPGHTHTGNVPLVNVSLKDRKEVTSPGVLQAVDSALTNLPLLAQETPSRSRPFRRVVSENLPNDDAEFDVLFDDFDDEPDDGLRLDSPKSNRRTPRRTYDSRSKPPPQLRQVTSDSAVFEAITSVREAAEDDELPRRATAQQVAEETPLVQASLAPHTEQQPHAAVESVSKPGDTGAWTPIEAFLLFDLWPPGKEKPDYGQSTTSLEVPSGAASTVPGTKTGVDAMSTKKYGRFGSARLVSQR